MSDRIRTGKAGDSISLLVLATSYPLGPSDSSSVFLKYLCQHLHRQGVEVHVLTPAQSDGGTVVEDGITVHRFRYMFRPWQKLAYGSGILPNLKRQPLLWLVLPFFLAGFLVATLVVTKRIRPDVIHGHWVIPTGVVALVASKLLRSPFILTAHGGDAFSLKSRLLSRLKKMVVRNAYAWTANTNATANAIIPDAVNRGCTIIPMGVDTDVFKPVPREERQANRTRRILFVGRLVEKKGASVLLRAISLLPQESRLQIAVDIVGDGAEKASLIQQARDAEIGDQVHFRGHVPNDELPQYLQNADVFVGPSIVDSMGDTEGQGVVFLEAMACGLPVIASNVGGIAEVINDGVNGILVPPGDAEILSMVINELLLDDSRRSGIASEGLELISTRYTWQLVSKRFLDLFEAAARSMNN